MDPLQRYREIIPNFDQFQRVQSLPLPPTARINTLKMDEQRLLERVAPLVRRQCVTLDLGSVERIDAAGIAALI